MKFSGLSGVDKIYWYIKGYRVITFDFLDNCTPRSKPFAFVVKEEEKFINIVK